MIAALFAAAALAVGDDAARAGALQRALDARTGLKSGETIAELRAKAVPDAPKPAVDVAWRKRADELATRVAREYYEGRLDDALLTLGGLDAHLTGAPYVPARDRVSLLLWRAAVFLERGDAEAARAPAAAALALDPALAVDEKVFPPSVTRLIAGQRAKPARTALLTLSGLPPRAQVFIDDRPRTSAANRIPVGDHRVLVTAPGFEWVALDAELSADLPLSVALPPAVDADVRAAVLAALRRGKAEAAETRHIASFAALLGVDSLAIAGALGPEPKKLGALVFARERIEIRPAAADTPAEEAAILDWIGKRVAPAVTSSSSRAPRRTVGVDVDGAMLGGVRVRTLSASQNGSFSSAFPAAGPCIRARGAHGRILGEADFGFSMSPNAVKVRDSVGATTNAGGSSTAFARIAAGARHPVEEGRLSFAATAGLAWESHRSNDALGLFPSYTRLALEVGLRASLPLRTALLEAGVTLVPFGALSESPASSSGSSAFVEPGGGFRVGLSVPRGGWRLAAALEGERRSVRFEGQGTAPIMPPLLDTRIEESRIGFSLSAGRRF